MASVILKVTERCNSNCYYCDVVNKQDQGGSMSLEVLEQVFIRTNEYLQSLPEERINLVWHGGEPLLLGPKYFNQVWEFQQEHCAATGNRVSHSIQTNLTCFREDFIPTFQKLGIGAVGTSYDPEPHMRGLGRERNTILYNAQFLRAAEILEKNNIGWGLIYVVTKRSLARPRDVFYFLTNLKLTGGINFNPVLIYDKERQDVAVSPEEYVQFLGEIFPLWWHHRSRYPDIEPFRSLVDNIIDGNTSLGCVDSGSCTFQHINIAPDGNTSQCGRSSDWGLLSYGNIRDRSFGEILSDSQREELAARVIHLAETECDGCRLWELCHGGCPLDSWSKHGEFQHKTEWCIAKRGFIEKYFEPITGTSYKPRGVLLPC